MKTVDFAGGCCCWLVSAPAADVALLRLGAVIVHGGRGEDTVVGTGWFKLNDGNVFPGQSPCRFSSQEKG